MTVRVYINGIRNNDRRNPSGGGSYHVRSPSLASPLAAINRFLWSSVMFRNNLKIAVRNLLKHKGFSFINVVGLALGVAAGFFVLIFVRDETQLRPVP